MTVTRQLSFSSHKDVSEFLGSRSSDSSRYQLVSVFWAGSLCVCMCVLNKAGSLEAGDWKSLEGFIEGNGDGCGSERSHHT